MLGFGAVNVALISSQAPPKPAGNSTVTDTLVPSDNRHVGAKCA